jgi:hypothetical protein
VAIIHTRPGLVPRGRLLQGPPQAGLLRRRLPHARSPGPLATKPQPALDVQRVEDQDDLRGILRDLLARSGYAVVEAADGQAGVTMAKSERADPGFAEVIVSARTWLQTLKGTQ